MKSAPALRLNALIFLSSALLAACGSLPSMPSLPSLPSLAAIKPYRIEIQQGNYLSQEMVSQLKRGMTREQVRFVLGTPLVADIFHANRWDYVFYREASDGTVERRQISVVFEADRLVQVNGDVRPAGGEKPAAETPAPAAVAPTDAPQQSGAAKAAAGN